MEMRAAKDITNIFVSNVLEQSTAFVAKNGLIAHCWTISATAVTAIESGTSSGHHELSGESFYTIFERIIQQ